MKQAKSILDDQIELDALTPAYEMARKTTFMSILAPTIVVTVMWSVVDQTTLVGWGILVLLGLFIQYLLTGSFLRQEVPAADVYKWGMWLSLVYFYFGLLWAAAVFLFYVDGQAEYQLFLLTLIVSFSMGTIVMGQHWFAMYYMYGPVTMAAVIVRLLMEGTIPYAALALVLFLIGLGSVSSSRILHNMVRSEMRQRYQGEVLTDELQRKTKEVEQATLAKSRFLAAASHDLRQPLHALSLFIDVLKEAKTTDQRKSIFPRIDLSLDALRKLFDALLDISRLDAKVIKPEFSHFNISDILHEVAEEHASLAQKKHLKLKVHARDLIVVTDRLLLERILRNLVCNALRYTDCGGVLISARLRNNSVLLQVWDTGIGIPQESEDEIFIEFQQLHNAHRDRTEGLGLGLAIVKRLCQLLGHQLELRSQPGKGSVFSVSVQQGDAHMVADKTLNNPVHSWNLGGKHVLVIDDEREILDAMDALLSKWGCDVVIAESLDDSIDSLIEKEVTPDLVLADLRLHNGETGIEAIDAIRSRFGENIPGILITGDTGADQIQNAKQSGYDLLQKPVRPVHLRSVIHQHLAG